MLTRKGKSTRALFLACTAVAIRGDDVQLAAAIRLAFKFFMHEVLLPMLGLHGCCNPRRWMENTSMSVALS